MGEAGRPPTRTQVSAGGVVFRQLNGRTEIALISVGEPTRWQLPKGLVDEGEETAVAALREVREETGLTATIVGPLDSIEYWYYATHRGSRVRYHKFVHYFLLRYESGDTAEHDHEVHEARWVEIDEAVAVLTFNNEKGVARQAREAIASLAQS
jgi:8-oxo-dGTP diphosphatase